MLDVAVVWALLSVATAADASVSWTAAAGAEAGEDPHGVVILGLKKGDWLVQGLTDTLDARWAPERDWGRVYVGVRGQGGTTGIMHTPWSGGVFDPTLGLSGRYLGLEVGGARYLPRGLYVGGEGFVRQHWFRAESDSGPWADAVPGPELRAEAAASAGFWHPAVHVWMRAGVHLAPDAQPGLVAPSSTEAASSVQPIVSLTLTSRPPEARLTARSELRLVAGGIGEDNVQDALSRTRVGGLSPYVVPLAGAGWAEFWVESVAAVRIGPSLKIKRTELEALLDGAVWSTPTDWGASPGGAPTSGWGTALRVRSGWAERGFVEVDLGYAPTLERPGGFPAVKGWLLTGVDWS